MLPLTLRTRLAFLRRSPLIRAALPALRLLAGVGLLAASLFQVDLPAAARLLGSVHPGWAALALLSVAGSTAIKIVRWGWLLRRLGAVVPWQQAAGSFLLGQSANILLPVRSGELVRAGALGVEASGKQPSLPAAAGAIVAATLLEKYADLVALSLLLALLGGESLLQAGGLALNASPWRLPAALAVTALLLGVAWLGPALWLRLRRLPLAGGLPQKLTTSIDHLVQSARAGLTPRAFLALFGVTSLAWVCMAFTNLLVMRALHLPDSPGAAWLVLALIYVGVAPALMPGNAGPFYFFAMLGLAAVDASAQQRAAFAAMLHALVTLLPLLAAAVYLILRPKPPG